MRTLAALLLAFALSFNGLAASTCVESEGDQHAMSGVVAEMSPHARADSDMASCNTCDDERPVGVDCHVMCLSAAPVLAAPDFAMHAPLFSDARPVLGNPPRLETYGPSPPRRPPRLQS